MGKKIEIWILFLIIILFFIIMIIFGGVLRDSYLKKNQTPKFLRDISVFISEIPKNIFFIIKSGNKPDILVKNSNLSTGFNRYINSDKDFLLVLPKYNNDLERSEVQIIDIKNLLFLTLQHF